jgi:TRAP-type C4-dicarboxylate transport system substrate-binding protein
MKGIEGHRAGAARRRPLSRRDFLKLSGAGVAGLSTMGAAGCGLASGGSEGGTTLRLTHQWPGVNDAGEGDFRAVLARRFADQVKEQTSGELTIEVYPNNSLIEESQEQYQAITNGTADLSVFPLDYASGSVPAFSITLMPAMVGSHAQAQKWQEAEIGQRVSQIMEDNGVKVLTWLWNAGAIGAKREEPILSPDDVPQGNVTRAAGPRVEQMLERVGFGLQSMSSSEIYSALQTGVLDSAITSTGSFSSYRIYEQVNSFTSPAGGNTFWFMFEPLIIGMDQFQNLSDEQQQIVESVGSDLQQYAYEAAEEDDARVDKEFREAGVNVQAMDDNAFQQWREASRPVWDDFASDVEGGRELIDLAEQVSA